ncbi:PREDICTED: endophilin-A-like isoform X2 [Priapulus caudatus]|nr:PREDICTED: endophilin-A-like isoform X2 [Priapulus caudatus]XP_014670978.1 PREDICTED: endophilin-A-like isoform X2 [Priapulus caudatus]
MSEKIGGAEATKLDEDFLELEKKTDVTNELVEELQIKTKEYLQPNPASRAKMSAMSSFSKIRGSSKYMPYPQPEGTLGDAMIKYGKDLGDDSSFGQALCEMGEAMKQLADIKYALEDNVKQNFLEPLHSLQNKELKEVMHHRKKLEGRRLDYDCKKRKKRGGSHMTDDEMRVAGEKFEESWNLSEAAMMNLLDSEVEQIVQVTALAEAQREYFKQSLDVIEVLVGVLEEKKREAENKPRQEPSVHVVPRASSNLSINKTETYDDKDKATILNNTDKSNRSKSPHLLFNDNAWPGDDSFNSANTQSAWPTESSPHIPVSASPKPAQPCCEALYDFDAENEGELQFKEGEIIYLIERIDENWFEGTMAGRTGFFPVTYVRVIVDLPNSTSLL